MATQALARNGAKVYIVGRTAEKLDTVVETYGKDISGMPPLSITRPSHAEKSLVPSLIQI